MDALKKMSEKLKDSANEFASKHETEINQAKAKAEELKGKAEETVDKAKAKARASMIATTTTTSSSGKPMQELGALDATNDRASIISPTQTSPAPAVISVVDGSIGTGTGTGTGTGIEVELGKETEAGIAAATDAEKEKIKKEIDDLGGSIKSAKTDKNNIENKSEMKKIIDPLIAKLLEAKAKFASMNGGIGVDGKSTTATAQGGGNSKDSKKNSDHAAANNVMATAKNAAKKAAKKAEKEAKKAAYKTGLIDSVTGGGMEGSGAPTPAPTPAVVTGTGTGTDTGTGTGTASNSNSNSNSTKGAPAAASKGNNNAKAAAAAAAAAAVPATAKAAKKSGGGGPPPLTNLSKFKLKPFQLVINPNVERMNERPVITLAVACLCDIDIDLNITSDHRVPQPMLGMEDGNSNSNSNSNDHADNGKGKAVVGDLASARYLLDGGIASRSSSVLSTSSSNERAEQNAWIEYSQSLTQLDPEQSIMGIAMTLEHALSKRTYLCGHKISLADIALFAALGFPCTITDKTTVLESFKDYPTATRWTKMMSSHPALIKATQLAVGASGATDAEAQFSSEDKLKLDPLVSGMNLLEGAIPGQVVTRFPPEPSGYLHVGHAKACLLNDYYAKRYKGRLIIRFDDTNPSKEKEEYQQSILEDLATLGVKGNVLTYTSDYIGAIQKYALQMISNGQAYMDDTPQEQMKDERMERKESKYRSSQTPDEAKVLFLDMCSGSDDGGKWCLRAKINMKSDNGTMRDPVLYRQNLTPHHRTGTQHKAYPTYDLACPIVDSLEGVTHALRTTEYNDRDEQYQFLLKALGLRRVRIHAFCRMNFQYTLLSKRKLTWFVNENLVTGWDDARYVL